MLFEISEFKMHNLKSRIKRKKQGMTRHDIPSSSTSSVGADWEFVNFNPFVYGPKRTASAESPPNVALIRATQSSHEDFYEFPTSTKLPTPTTSVASSQPDAPEAPPVVRRLLERQGARRDRHYRHSLHSTYDLFHPVPSRQPNLSINEIPRLTEEIGSNPNAESDSTPQNSSIRGSKFYVPPPVPGTSRRSSLTILDTPNSAIDSCPPLIPFPASNFTRRQTSFPTDSDRPHHSPITQRKVTEAKKPLENSGKSSRLRQSKSPQTKSINQVVSPSRLPIPISSHSKKLKPTSALVIGVQGNGLLDLREVSSWSICKECPLFEMRLG